MKKVSLFALIAVSLIGLSACQKKVKEPDFKLPTAPPNLETINPIGDPNKL